MSQGEKQQNSTESEDQQLSTGPTETKSKASNNLVDREGIGLTTSKMIQEENKRKREESVTVGSHQQDRKKICSDKLSTCNPSIRDTKSSQTLPVDSTSKGKVLKPFFDQRCKEMSKQLSSHTKIDWHDSGIQSWNSSFRKETLNCSASLTTNIDPKKKNSSLTFYQSSQSSAAESMVQESTKKTTRVRKVRLYPNQLQKKQFRKWFGDTRYTYNSALAYTKKHEHKFNMIWLRNRLVINQNLPYSKKFLKDTPKHIREGAIKDLVSARKAALSNAKNGNIKHFELGFRSKKSPKQSIVIPKAAIRVCESGLFIYKQFTKDAIVCNTKKIEVKHDCRLVFENGLFYLCVPTDIEYKVEARKRSYVGVDPGVRCFACAYSLNGCLKYGENLRDVFYKRLLRLDALKSKIDTEKRKRNKQRKMVAFKRLSSKFHNIRRDIHYKMAHHMCTNFTDIIMPHFENHQMSAKGNRQLKTKTVRQMFSLAHGKFRVRLMETAERYGSTVHDITEPFTTKGCSGCGHIVEDLGGSKEFHCPNCGSKFDRDINSGKNFILKYAVENDFHMGIHAYA